MDSLELNKAAAAVLLAGIAFVGSGLIGKALVHPRELEHQAINIVVPEAGTGGGAPAAQEPPIAELLASADASRGEAGVKAQGCVACHSFAKGGKDGVGPNLYGVVGAPHGHEPNFAYSAALKGKQGPWDFAALSSWLLKPSGYAPGTKMSYAGLADPKKRADIIEYLRTLADQPLPRPEASAAPASGTTTAAGTNPGAAGANASGGVMPAAAAGGGAPEPIAVRLASADAKAGQADTMKLGCVACHTYTEGGKAGIGPNLYNVVGAPHGHQEGFAYSASLKSKTGPWSYEELDKWLTKPAAYAPGTKMTFVGIADPKARADVIAYLRSLSASPQPLPTP